ncbi:MAG: cytochrome b5-like heme/steroid binding domain-containing protein [Nanoarchaeota archaeon]
MVGLIVFLYPANQQTPKNLENRATGATVSDSSAIKIFSVDLSKHNALSDCWVGYQGKAYDITAWLPKHPGSADAILPYCGTSSEFETAFKGQHGTYQVGKLIKEGKYKGDLG